MDDHELKYCLEFNGQEGFDVDDIEEILAVHEGEYDGDNFAWVIKLNDGRFAGIQGGCCYTGWDCSSSADSYIAKTPELAIKAMVAAVSSVAWYGFEDIEAVNKSLLSQLKDGKAETWREKKDKEFGIDD